jgi:hypothetical protein
VQVALRDWREFLANAQVTLAEVGLSLVLVWTGGTWAASPSAPSRRCATPTTTLRYYAKWIPSQGRRWVAVLDQADITAGLDVTAGRGFGSKVGTKKWNQTGFPTAVVAQAIEKRGEPSGIRTLDPLIKSRVATF